jgi:sec-independent protein translocase protein TatC
VSIDDEEVAPDEGMTLMEHLDELRSRLIKCAIAVIVGMVLAWTLYPGIYDFLVQPLCDVIQDSATETVVDSNDCGIALREPLEGLSIRLRVSGYVGIGFAMPVLLWQLWKFITPGLYEHEKRYALPFVFSSLFLFVLGAGLAYFTVARALDFLITIAGGDMEILFSPEPYIKLVTYMMLAFGIGFEFPVVLVALQLVGVLQTTTLRRVRRYAYVGILILVAVITPSGDPYSMLLLSVPMIVFYEIAILIGRFIERNRLKKALAGGS